jgi:hypothetical protein
MSVMGRLRLGGLVIALIGVAIYSAMRSSEQKKMSFRGAVVWKEEKQITRRTSVYILTINSPDGKEYKWEVSESDEGYFQVDDYLVKLPGKSKVAVFRHGKQMRGLPFYLDEEVDRNQPAPGEAPGATAAATETESAGAPSPTTLPIEAAQPAAPGAAQAPAPPVAQDSPVTEQEAQRLLAESGRLWTAGDKVGAVKCSEKALAIRIQLYGENHPLVTDVRNKITAAQQLIAQERPGR